MPLRFNARRLVAELGRGMARLLRYVFSVWILIGSKISEWISEGSIGG